MLVLGAECRAVIGSFLTLSIALESAVMIHQEDIGTSDHHLLCTHAENN